MSADTFWNSTIPVKDHETYLVIKSRCCETFLPGEKKKRYLCDVYRKDYHDCAECFTHIELDKIKKIPAQQLPLYVNQIWLTEEGRTFFMKRLKEM